MVAPVLSRMSFDPIARSVRGGLIAQGDAASACEAGQAFDLIVLCAEEFQPHRSLICKTLSPVSLLYAPNDDAKLTSDQIRIATAAAENVAYAYGQGKKVLVTCMQGRNRSGLVSAIALHLHHGISGEEAANLVKKQRKNALTNPYFVDFLSTIPERPNGQR